MPLKSQWKKNVVNEHYEGGFTNKTHRKGKPQQKNQPRGCPIPTKAVVLKNLKKWSCVKQTSGWRCPTTLKEVGVC